MTVIRCLWYSLFAVTLVLRESWSSLYNIDLANVLEHPVLMQVRVAVVGMGSRQ